jgi:hypothetical protein
VKVCRFGAENELSTGGVLEILERADHCANAIDSVWIQATEARERSQALEYLTMPAKKTGPVYPLARAQIGVAVHERLLDGGTRLAVPVNELGRPTISKTKGLVNALNLTIQVPPRLLGRLQQAFAV